MLFFAAGTLALPKTNSFSSRRYAHHSRKESPPSPALHKAEASPGVVAIVQARGNHTQAKEGTPHRRRRKSGLQHAVQQQEQEQQQPAEPPRAGRSALAAAALQILPPFSVFLFSGLLHGEAHTGKFIQAYSEYEFHTVIKAR